MNNPNPIPVTTVNADAILFDLDGVLIDSTTSIVQHWREWAEQHNLDLDFILQNAHGMRTIETMRIVAPHLNVEEESRRFTANEITDTAGVVSIDGARPLLTALPPANWAIVTSCGMDLVKIRLSATGLPIPTVLITADDVQNGKPSPEPYLAGARRMGLSVDRCVVIEDAPAGILAGKKAGMRVIAIASTHPRQELLDSGADFVVAKLQNLKVTQSNHQSRLTIHLEGE
ncbi:MAG: HAD family hydrolase [Chloroflexi bacterium]|nr:HAD family hydrolase [Chloroflexota bacterium]